MSRRWENIFRTGWNGVTFPSYNMFKLKKIKNKKKRGKKKNACFSEQ